MRKLSEQIISTHSLVFLGSYKIEGCDAYDVLFVCCSSCCTRTGQGKYLRFLYKCTHTSLLDDQLVCLVCSIELATSNADLFFGWVM